MDNLIMLGKEQTITSLEVAEMVEKRHTDLLRDIKRYCEQFNESNIALVDFFQESTYVDAKGETRPRKPSKFRHLRGNTSGKVRFEI